ncbi:MAG: putative zinc-binding protein [Chloroflexi bacterium]|nr:putative zinc-binding protein [Chloroflexota bacterium]
MPALPKRKVGIISCSGEEFPEGSVSRMAARIVLEELRPDTTVTLCLPLFLAGNQAERAFAKFYPTIAVDGCDKRCAARATAMYSAEPAHVIVVSEIAKRYPELKPESRAKLGKGGMELARLVAEEIAQQVDEILAKPYVRRVIPIEELLGSGEPGNAAASSLVDEKRSQASS